MALLRTRNSCSAVKSQKDEHGDCQALHNCVAYLTTALLCLSRRSKNSFHFQQFSAQSSFTKSANGKRTKFQSLGHRIFLILRNARTRSVPRSNPQIYYSILQYIALQLQIHPPTHPPTAETQEREQRERTERVDLQCWHLKQERWKTTPSVDSWSIGYTVLVHTLHFCCVPLNILAPILLAPTPWVAARPRSAQDLRAPPDPALAFARAREEGTGRMRSTSARRPRRPRIDTQEVRRN